MNDINGVRVLGPWELDHFSVAKIKDMCKVGALCTRYDQSTITNYITGVRSSAVFTMKCVHSCLH